MNWVFEAAGGQTQEELTDAPRGPARSTRRGAGRPSRRPGLHPAAAGLLCLPSEL